MPNDSQDRLFSGFVRQRRNLVVISLLVLFTHYAQINITQINVLGNHVDVGNPDAVYYGLWAAFFYWLIRYYQYYRDLGGSSFKSEIYGRICKYLCEYARKTYKTHDAYLKKLEAMGENVRTQYIKVEDCSIVGQQPWRCRLKVLYRVEPDGGGSIGDVFIEPTGWPLRWMKLRAVPYVLIHTRVFTEYWLPYVLAGVVILHGLPVAIVWLEHFTA